MAKNMTDDELLALAKKAQKIVPGAWERDSIETDGHYGSGPDVSEGFDEFGIYADGDLLFDSTNTDRAEIEVEYDDDTKQAWNEISRIIFDYIAAASPVAIISMIDRRRAEVEELRERVGFIEGNVSIEDMPDHYAWAVNELTARKAYSKSECATLIAEQRAEVERLTRELEIAEQDAAHFNRLAFVDVGANPPVAWKDEATRLTRERDEARRESEHWQDMADHSEAALAAAQKRVGVLREALEGVCNYFSDWCYSSDDGCEAEQSANARYKARAALKESGNGDETVRRGQRR